MKFDRGDTSARGGGDSMWSVLLSRRVFPSPAEAVDLVAGLLESSTEQSLIVLDEEQIIRVWNEGARRLYGYADADAVGRSWSLLHTERDVRDGLPTRIAARAVAEGKWEGNVERVRKDGSHFMAHVVVTPRHDAEGRFVGFLLISGYALDEVWLHSGGWVAMRAVIDAAPDAMVIVDRSGVIQLVNAGAEELFGYPREQLAGQSVEMLMPPRHRGGHAAHVAEYFADPRRRSMGAGTDFRALRADGVELAVDISLNPLQTQHGLHATAAIRDVTEHRRTERRLRDANVALEAANRAKDRFLGRMSHELRTPLNAILGFTGTLLMELPGPLNEEQARQLRTVQSNGRHLLALLNELLELARIESGKRELQIELLDCAGLLDDVAAELRPLAEEKGIALEVQPSAQPLEVRSDRRALAQILANLTDNAIKFTDEGGVRLRASRTDGAGGPVRFEVVDSGRGIRAEDRERVFAAFEQVGAGPGRGTGLGLHICRTLSSLLGGELTFESEVGRGTTFSLALPGR